MNTHTSFVANLTARLAVGVFLALSASAFSAEGTNPVQDDFVTRLTLARALSYTNRADQLGQSVTEYKTLMAARPNDITVRAELAEVLTRLKRYDEALQQWNAVLGKITGDAKAQLAVARILLWTRHYDEAIQKLVALKAHQPVSADVLLELAHAYAWSGRFEQSLAAYRDLDTADPVVLKEEARVAYWAKMPDMAFRIYDAICTPTVDRQLADALGVLALKTGNSWLKDQSEKATARSRQQGPPYRAYEQFTNQWAEVRVAPDVSRQVEGMLVRLGPAYRIQKAAWLERQVKWLDWNLRFKQGLKACSDLVTFCPSNEEAWFDLSQMQHILGLVPQANQTCRQLLDLDPLHNRVSLALENGTIETHPTVQAGYMLFDEQGRGNLDQITRQRMDGGVDVPLWSPIHLGVTGHEWLERPRFNKETYRAFGQSLSLGGVLNDTVSGGVEWTHKNYSDGDLDNTDTGYARLHLNLNDILQAEGGYGREDVLDNYFGLKQRLQADNWWIRPLFQFTHALSAEAVARYLNYNDQNNGQLYRLSAAYALTDHPRILKLIVAGDYRDTKEKSQEIFDNTGALVDITHPYWTPQSYVAGTVALEWRHDLAPLFFSAADQHWYDLKCVAGTDSEDNPSIELDGEWCYQFRHHWTAGVAGMITQSRLYNAEFVSGRLQYQF
ncbi:MAG: hypothetical protein Q8O57_09005 [Kiritimatiellota bacterium]|nr:hypothetical protein [Kiritimatiellota bacterium]